jgi:hypothetical protein
MSSGAAAGASRVRLAVTLIVSLLVAGVCNPPHDEYLQPVNISNNAGRSEDPACAVDSRGTVHLVWTDNTPGLESGSGNEAILYASKTQGGTWTEPAVVSDTDRDSRFPTIAVGPGDRLHVAWQCFMPGPHWVILYSWKAGDSGWATPETVSGDYNYLEPKIALDSSGDVHLAWAWGGYDWGFRYAERLPSGVWTPQEDLVPIGMTQHGRIATDPSGTVHFVYCYQSQNLDTSDVYYRTKPRNGNWSSPQNISNSGDVLAGDQQLGLIADRAGNIYAVWVDYLSLKLLCRRRDPAGVWDGTGGAVLCTLHLGYTPRGLAIGPSGELYLPASGPRDPNRGAYYLEYLKKPQEQPWSDTLVCGMVREDPYGMGVDCFACDNQGLLHFIGDKTPKADSLDNIDIYTVDYKPQRR